MEVNVQETIPGHQVPTLQVVNAYHLVWGSAQCIEQSTFHTTSIVLIWVALCRRRRAYRHERTCAPGCRLLTSLCAFRGEVSPNAGRNPSANTAIAIQHAMKNCHQTSLYFTWAQSASALTLRSSLRV